MEDLIDRFTGARVAVLGDLILDRYTWGSSSRISPEAPVPVVNVDEKSTKLGGAGNSAQAMSALGADVGIFSRLGDDNPGQVLRELIGAQSMSLHELPNEQEHPTTVKTRVIAEGQHLVRIDEEDRTCISKGAVQSARDQLEETFQPFDAVLLSDYGKGVLSGETLPVFLDLFEGLDLPVVVDPYTDHFRLYENATVLTPNETEFREGIGDSGPRQTPLERLVEEAFGKLDAGAILVTQGERGMTLFQQDRDTVQISTEAREVYDVTGAGDTVSGIMTLAEATGSDRVTSMKLANLAAGIVVGRMGTAAVTAGELTKEIET